MDSKKMYEGKWFVQNTTKVKVRIMVEELLKGTEGREYIHLTFGQSVDIPELQKKDVSGVTVETLKNNFTLLQDQVDV